MGRREIKSSWSQFLAIIAIGGIAVTLFVGLLANAQSFENRVNASYDEGNMADIWVTAKTYDEADEGNIQALSPDGTLIAKRFESTGRINHNQCYPTIVPSLPAVSKPTILSQSADSTDTHFFFVDKALAESVDGASFQVGSKVEMSFDLSALKLSSYKQYLVDDLKDPTDTFFDKTGVSLSYQITGIMRFPENIQKAAYSPSIVLFSSDMFRDSVRDYLGAHFTTTGVNKIFEYLREAEGLEWGDGDPNGDVTNFPRANQYLLSCPDHLGVKDAKTKIGDYYSAKKNQNLLSVNDRDNMPFVIVVQGDVKQARQFTFLFPFVFFSVAILVILTTTSQIILKERTQIGTMKALGLSKNQIYAHYMLLTDAVVAIGIIIGEVIGPILIPAIMDKKYSIIYTLPTRGYLFPVLYGLLTAAAFLFIATLVTYIVCRREVRLKPAESMRPASPKIPAKASFSLTKRVSTRLLSLKMAFRNIRFDKVKSIMVGVGVMGCTALLVCGFGIEDTVYYGIDHDMSQFNNAALTLAFSSAQDRTSFLDDLQSVDGVDYQRSDLMTRGNGTITYEGLSSNSYVFILPFDPGAANSHFQIPSFDKSTVSVSDKVARDLKVKVGDTISFKYNDDAYSAPVSQIFKAFVFNGVAIYSDAPFLKAPVTSFIGASVELKEGADPATVKAAIMNQAVEGGRFSYVTECNTKQDWSNQVTDIMGGVLVMTNAVKVFGILLAIVVLYNLALLNFRERTRDIATLKVLGFSKWEIASSLLWETMTLTFVGVGLGFAMGYPFLIGVLKLNQVSLANYLYTIKLSSYGWAFLLTFVVDFIVNGWLSLRTGKVKMVESLKSVE